MGIILVYKLPIENFRDLPAPVSFAWLDQSKHIWLCNEESIFIYNTDTGEVTHIKNDISEEINDIDGVKIDFADKWVHLRKSNTEPIIRVYSEASTAEAAEEIGQKIMKVIEDLAK